MTTTEQDPQLGFFSFSTLGAPILIDTSSGASPTKIHEVDTSASGNAEQIYLRLHNNSDSRVKVHVMVHPASDSAQSRSDATLTVVIPANSSMVVLDGVLLKEYTTPPSSTYKGVTAWCDDSADATAEYIKAYGWVIDTADPITND